MNPVKHLLVVTNDCSDDVILRGIISRGESTILGRLPTVTFRDSTRGGRWFVWAPQRGDEPPPSSSRLCTLDHQSLSSPSISKVGMSRTELLDVRQRSRLGNEPVPGRTKGKTPRLKFFEGIASRAGTRADRRLARTALPGVMRAAHDGY